MLSLQRQPSSSISNMTPWFARPVMISKNMAMGSGSAGRSLSSPDPEELPINYTTDDHDEIMETFDDEDLFCCYSNNNPKNLVIKKQQPPQIEPLNLQFPQSDVMSFRNRYPPLFKKRSQQQQQQTTVFEEDLPSDPRTWSRDDVCYWLRFMSAAHSLPTIQTDRFLMNGKALCLMSMEMFCQRVPLGGKMLYKDFQLRLSMALYKSKQ